MMPFKFSMFSGKITQEDGKTGRFFDFSKTAEIITKTPLKKNSFPIFPPSCKYFLSLMIIALCFSPRLAAAKISIDAEVESNTVPIGEPFSYNITITVEGQNGEPEFTQPNFDNLSVIRRSSQRGQSFVMNFGSAPKVQMTLTYSYLLQANKTGGAQIGPASARLGNELVSTKLLSLQIVDSGSHSGFGFNSGPQTARRHPSAAPTPTPPSDSLEANGESILLRAVPDRFEAYVGEQVILSVFLLSRVELADIQNLSQPQLSGVLLERDERPRTNLTPRIQRFNGIEYQVFEVARFAVFPLHEGKVTIGSFALDAQSGGFAFFSTGRNYHVTSVPVDINAKALPSAGRPSSFAQMNVGKFSFQSQLLANSTQVGKPVTLRISVNGSGNISKLELPKPNFGPKLRAFDPETKVERHFDQGALSGRITRDYLVVPSAPGQYNIGPLSFSYFDPQAQIYREEKSSTLTFMASGDAASSTTTAVTTPSTRGDQRQLRPPHYRSDFKDDRPAHLNPILLYVNGGFVSFAFMFSLFVPLLRRQVKSEDISRRALSRAQRRLRQLRGEKNKTAAQFYADVHKIMTDYLHERFSLSLGASREQIRSALYEMNIPDQTIHTLLSELDNCDFARFAPGAHERSQTEAATSRVESVLQDLERPLKSRRKEVVA